MSFSAFAPYIGVTGYRRQVQVAAVHEAVSPKPGEPVLMDGFLVWSSQVHDRWRGDASSAPVNFSKRFMDSNESEKIFGAPPDGSLRMIHLRTTVQSQLDEQLADCIEAYGIGVDGFQINWLQRPSPEELAGFRKSFDRLRAAQGREPCAIVLQLHPQVLEDVGSLSGVVGYVADYVEGESITHVLYDPSGGQGLPFNPLTAIAAAKILRRHFPSLHLGVAGGLGPGNVVDMMRPIWTLDPSISIDVEGGVRTTVMDDELDVALATSFVTRAFNLLCEINPNGADERD